MYEGVQPFVSIILSCLVMQAWALFRTHINFRVLRILLGWVVFGQAVGMNSGKWKSYASSNHLIRIHQVFDMEGRVS